MNILLSFHYFSCSKPLERNDLCLALCCVYTTFWD